MNKRDWRNVLELTNTIVPEYQSIDSLDQLLNSSIFPKKEKMLTLKLIKSLKKDDVTKTKERLEKLIEKFKKHEGIAPFHFIELIMDSHSNYKNTSSYHFLREHQDNS